MESTKNLFDRALDFNKLYREKEGEQCVSCLPKYPREKVAILTCMDTRLTLQLERALGLERGDAIELKTAGNNMRGQELRSLIVAIFGLRVEKIMVIGHTDCGMENLNVETLTKKMLARGVDPKALEELGNLEEWFEAFCDSNENVTEMVDLIKNHPLVPKDIEIAGFNFDQDIAELTRLC